MSTFNYELALLCLEQKNVIVKEVMDITKRMEEESLKEEINLDSLIAERQSRIDRIKKCDQMLASTTDGLEESERERIQGIVNGSNSADFLNPNEEKMADYVVKTKADLKTTVEIDRRTMDILIQKRNEAREMLVQINNEQAENQ